MSEQTEYISPDQKKSIKTDLNKCASCGAALSFDPETQTLLCEFCGSQASIVNDSDVQEILLNFSNDAAKWSSETKVFHCETCGAETVFSKNEFAKLCVFCGAPAVTEKEDLEGVRPNAVIPFRLTSSQAKQSYEQWVKRKFFAPSAFKRIRVDGLFSSLYLPSWTFDSDSASTYKGVVGDYYYVTVRRNGKSYSQRRVRYRNVSGSHNKFFDDILLGSGVQCPNKLFDKLKPFPLSNAVVYSPEFLAGHLAEHYSLSLKDGWDGARAIMERTINYEIRRSLKCDVVSSLKVSTTFAKMTYKYLLLPVYTYTERFKKKVYKFFVNGCSGTVSGRTPVSPLKVTLTVLAALALTSVAAFIARLFQ